MKHTGAPDDLRGIHFDLLLEDKKFCRSWRLSDIPLLDGPYVESIQISPHKLDWLEITEKVVSGKRGVATRIKKGIFFNSLPDVEKYSVNLEINWENVHSHLVIDQSGCKIFSKTH